MKLRCLLVILGVAVACAKPAGTGRPSDQQWDDAREVAEKWAVDLAGVPPSAIGAEVKSMPFFFETTASPTGMVLVHGGMVWTDTGINALAQYLHEANVYQYEALTLRDALRLVRHFDALPPVLSKDGNPEDYQTVEGPLGPAFAWRGHQMELTLRYKLPAPADSARTKVAEWTLVLGKGVQPRWREERRDYDLERGEFIHES